MREGIPADSFPHTAHTQTTHHRGAFRSPLGDKRVNRLTGGEPVDLISARQPRHAEHHLATTGREEKGGGQQGAAACYEMDSLPL